MKDCATEERKRRIEEGFFVVEPEVENIHFWRACLLGLFLSACIIAICVLLAGCTVRVDARWADDARGLETDNDRHQLESILEDSGELYEDDEVENKKGE